MKYRAAVLIGALVVAVTACATPALAPSAPSGPSASRLTPVVAAQLAEVTAVPFRASDADGAVVPLVQLARHAGHPLTAGGKPEDKAHGTPFADFGGKVVMTGSPIPPQTLEHLTWSQLTSALRAHRGAAAQAVIGAADYITAELCALTRNRPASACPPSIKDFQM